MRVRDGAQRVEVYNEGLIVYLYDPAHAEAIVAANPSSVLEVCDVEYSKDKALKQLVKDGLFAAYELDQDDPVAVDIVVGEPLTKEEMKRSGAKWLKPLTGVLNIQSGRLRVDSANTFRLSKEARFHAQNYAEEHGKPPKDSNYKAFGLSDPSGEAKVPPGEYMLTLHRVDFDAFDEEEEWEGPSEVITLTPLTESNRPKKLHPVIPHSTSRVYYKYQTAARVKDGVFEGRVLSTKLINFTQRHAEQLGLRRGQRLRVQVGDQPYDMIFLGGADPLLRAPLFELLYPDRLAALEKKHPGLLRAAVYTDSITHLWLMRLYPFDMETDPGFEKGAVVRIEPTDEFLLPPPEVPRDAIEGRIEGDTLHGIVLACGPGGIELGVGRKQLTALGLSKAAELVLSIGDWSTRVLYLSNPDDEIRPWHIVHTVDDDDEELASRVFRYFNEGGDAVFRTIAGIDAADRIESCVREYVKGCRFTSKDGYVPKDLERGRALKAEYVALWRERLDRWQPPSVVQALCAPHWDDPKLNVLECRTIQRPGVIALNAPPGTPYTLRLLGGE